MKATAVVIVAKVPGPLQKELSVACSHSVQALVAAALLLFVEVVGFKVWSWVSGLGCRAWGLGLRVRVKNMYEMSDFLWGVDFFQA